MRTGNLDRYATIQQNTPVVNAFGEAIPTWALFKNAWVSKQDTGGNERWIAKQFLAEVDTLFKTHYIAGVGGGMRLSIKNDAGQDEMYDILAVLEIGRREGIAINAKRRAD